MQVVNGPDKNSVGLGNVDNTADANKPVSTAQSAAIALKKTDSMTTNKLLGRGTAGTGAIEEITLGTNLSLTGTTLNAAGGGSGATNLSQTLAATTLGINSDTGTDIVVEAADAVNAGVMTNAMFTKLSGIATGATANSSDATLLARANHTGTQSADTITDGTTNKAYTATEKTKLAGVATAATANATDASLRDRSTHTGTQTADTITDGTTNKAYTATEKTKLAGIATGATVYTDTMADARVAAGITGKVDGPASSTDNAITRMDGTTGKLIQSSLVTISDAGTVFTPANNGFSAGNNGFFSIDSGVIYIDETSAILYNVLSKDSLKVRSSVSGWDTSLNPGATAGNITLNLPITADTLVGRATTDTMTNKRITPRIDDVYSNYTISFTNGTLSVDSDTKDAISVNKIGAATAISNPTGTPTQMQKLMFRFKDDGTARALSWDTAYAPIGVTLPTTTVANKWLYVGCVYNAATTKWDVIAVAQEA